MTLGELKNQLGKTDAAQQTQDRLIAFLAKNGFWVYPNAYVKEKNAIANMVEALNNIEEKQVGEHVQKMWKLPVCGISAMFGMKMFSSKMRNWLMFIKILNTGSMLIKAAELISAVKTMR